MATPAPTQDVTPPTLVLPAPVTAEATAATGAVVGFDARASDGDTTCTPASGATFALGTTTVTCTARDASGNEASGTFTVTIADTTAPALSLPGETGAQATSAAGATVGYAASAADAVDGAVATSCSPASGSTFPVGTTTVTCSATDAHSNSATGSFQVTVTPLPQPDLVVSAVTGTSFTVANLGTAPAGVFTVAVQGGGVLTFAGLAPGASATRTVACASVQRQVAVDPTNVVAEADEGNNTGRLPAC